MTMNYNLKDKIFVVTGGTRGIGLEIAREILNQQGKVAVCARKQEGLEAAARELGNPDRLLTVAAHIAKPGDVERLFTEVSASLGDVDVLVNNVGMNFVTPSVADTDPETWQKIIDTNLNGTFLCSRAAARIMKAKKSGKIISITSIAARKASPAMGIYGIAKAGIEMLTRVLAAELAAYNIQVNAVAPSMVRTDFSRPFWSNKDIHDQIVRSIPLGRIADPADVVHPVLFLASEGANFITGQVIPVDGGATVI
ncbi:MAG TPA: SDR family oxidoreductase [Spirochaetota bacterium]|nr:SDR family oxidoreductase [Spirochaetota bacterium]HPI91166.1 SDR family oxidoreductase [Spirochaetota bacterium]HPR46914.1 SDR family oxidoreductase [Spirochaetota bacterium]